MAPDSAAARVDRSDDWSGRQQTPSDALPDPRPLVLGLTRCVVEILAGARDPEQIARWVDPEVYARLLQRVTLAARARQATGAPWRRPVFSLGSTRIVSPADGVVEAVSVVHDRGRTRAVTMRLVGLDRRWRVTFLAVL